MPSTSILTKSTLGVLSRSRVRQGTGTTGTRGFVPSNVTPPKLKSQRGLISGTARKTFLAPDGRPVAIDVFKAIQRNVCAEGLKHQALWFERQYASLRPDEAGKSNGMRADICADLDDDAVTGANLFEQLHLEAAEFTVFLYRAADILVVTIVKEIAISTSGQLVETIVFQKLRPTHGVSS